MVAIACCTAWQSYRCTTASTDHSVLHWDVCLLPEVTDGGLWQNQFISGKVMMPCGIKDLAQRRFWCSLGVSLLTLLVMMHTAGGCQSTKRDSLAQHDAHSEGQQCTRRVLPRPHS